MDGGKVADNEAGEDAMYPSAPIAIAPKFIKVECEDYDEAEEKIGSGGEDNAEQESVGEIWGLVAIKKEVKEDVTVKDHKLNSEEHVLPSSSTGKSEDLEDYFNPHGIELICKIEENVSSQGLASNFSYLVSERNTSGKCSAQGSFNGDPLSMNFGDNAQEMDISSELSPLKERESKQHCYKCVECGKALTSGYKLKLHMRIHTGQKPYDCTVCGKAFTDRSNLIVHARMHTGIKPYKCEVCGRTFCSSSVLKIHSLVHSGLKLYECDYCGKSFSHRHNLKSHFRSHTGEKPYICEVCSCSFTARFNLKRHMLIHNREKPNNG